MASQHRRAHRGRPARRRVRGDRGAASSLAIALLTPVFIVLSLAAFQAALWSHARTEARLIARDTAALVARSNVAPADAQASALAILASDTDLANARVVVDTGADLVTVTITGAAPGIVRGTSSDLSVSVAVPREGWTP
jgi:hypothetical protein